MQLPQGQVEPLTHHEEVSKHSTSTRHLEEAHPGARTHKTLGQAGQGGAGAALGQATLHPQQERPHSRLQQGLKETLEATRPWGVLEDPISPRIGPGGQRSSSMGLCPRGVHRARHKDLACEHEPTWPHHDLRGCWLEDLPGPHCLTVGPQLLIS